MRISALIEVDGYRDDLIAGEEPELCLRLRRKGWGIERLDHEMTRHDAQILRFDQWWARSRRAGHAFAEGAHLHGAPPERHWVRETRRALFWGFALPIVAATPWTVGLLLLYPIQFLRLATISQDWHLGAFSILGKFPEALGVIQFHRNRLFGRKSAIVEYK